MKMPVSLKAIAVALLLASLCLVCGCSRQPPTNQPSSSPEINVAAATKLTEAFAEVAKQFTKDTGVRVVYSFGAMAELEKQIENGAPFDVFAVDDVEHISQLSDLRRA